jgi:hypothetical protein
MTRLGVEQRLFSRARSHAMSGKRGKLAQMSLFPQLFVGHLVSRLMMWLRSTPARRQKERWCKRQRVHSLPLATTERSLFVLTYTVILFVVLVLLMKPKEVVFTF